MAHDKMRLLALCVQSGMHGSVKGLTDSGRNIPFLLTAYPGVAKTQVVQGLGAQIAAMTKKPFPVEVFTAPQRMPEEIGGIPVPFYELNEVRCLPMRIGKNLLKEGRGIFFIDEISSASQAMGGSCMTLIQDGRFGDETLPNTVARGAAQNPPECAVNGRALTAPESNRFCHIDWELDFNSYADFVRGGRGVLSDTPILPPDWEAEFGMKNRGLVLAFLRKFSAMFDVTKTMPKAHDAGKPWASPRSWLNTARLLGACEAVGARPDSDLAMLAVRGCVGDGPADALLGWFREMDLPDPEEMLKHPDKALKMIPPGRPDKLQVALETLATAASQDHKDIEKRYVTAWNILIPVLESEPDNALYAAQILARAQPKVPKVEMPKASLTIKAIFERVGLK